MRFVRLFVLAVAPLVLAGSSFPQWSTETVHGSAWVGFGTSLDVDASGKVHISYVNFDTDEIWYATDSSGPWTTEPVASIWGVWPGGTSIAVDATGAVHIAFYDDTSYGDFRYATNASGAWVVELIDSSGDCGWYNDLVLYGGAVHVCYENSSTNDLMYATNATGAWVPRVAAAGSEYGSHCSMAIDGTGAVHISHYDHALHDSVYTTNAGGAWATEVVDMYDGGPTSIALDAGGNAHITYSSQSGLEHATKVGAVWVSTTIDPGARNVRSSLLVVSAGHLHVGLAGWYATNASGAWVAEVVDSQSSYTHGTLDMDAAGDLHLAYFDTVAFVLRYAATGKIDIYGCGTNPADSLTIGGGVPALGSTVTLVLNNPLDTQGSGSLSFLAVSSAPDPNYPCGTPVPGWGMTAPGSMGEVLISMVPPDPAAIFLGGYWLGPSQPVSIDVTVAPVLVGLTAYAQGLLLDPYSTYGIKFGLTDAAALHIEF